MGPDDEIVTPDLAGSAPDTAAPVAAPETSKPVDVRETVRAAFETLKNGKADGSDGETSATPKLEGQDGKPRDQRGRFAPKSGEPVAAGSDEQQRAAPDKPAAQSQEQTPQRAGPPPGWSPKSKADWERIPEHIRADIAKREAEMDKGFAALKDYRELRPYADMAQRSGTTLTAALHAYTNMEQELTRDPASGFMTVAKNLGLSKPQAAQLFASLAQRLGHAPHPAHQTGGDYQDGLDQNDPLMEAIAPLVQQVVSPMRQQLENMTKHLTSRELADQKAVQAEYEKVMESIVADPKYRYFADLEEDMATLFELGKVQRSGNLKTDIERAYELAARSHPEVQEALISERLRAKEEDAKAKTAAARKAAVSLNGAPGAAARSSSLAPGSDVRTHVRAAFNELRSQI